MSSTEPVRAHELGPHFAHLDRTTGITAIPVGEDFWGSGIAALPAGRLLSAFRTEADWTSWEMHPQGDELILQLSGEMALRLEFADGREASLRLPAGHFTIVPPGTWHTADVVEPGEALYITAGEGTEHRPRT